MALALNLCFIFKAEMRSSYCVAVAQIKLFDHKCILALIMRSA